MRRPHQNFFNSPWAEQLDRKTSLIYPLGARSVVTFVAAPFLFGRRFWGALGNTLFGSRESVRARIAAMAHFFVACHWAHYLRREEVSLIHSQWIHSCGTIGMYGAWLLDVPFSFTGHATDLFRDRVALRDKIRRADTIICISSFHREFYRELGATDNQLRVVYCGIDVRQFAPRPSIGEKEPRLNILAAGRLVEKKGFRHLIDACRLLARRRIPIRCIIAGSGPLEPAMARQIREQGLDSSVTLTRKELKQEEISEFMAQGDVFCLPCVWAKDHDVDGLPQLLMEAMACGLPVISTDVAGIPDLIVNDQTGLLVRPGSATEIADALERIFRDPALRTRLASHGRRWVEERFDIDHCLEPLIELFWNHLPHKRERLDLPLTSPS